MKHLSRFLVASLLIMVIGSVNAQDKNNPWAISVGANAIDTYPVGDNAREPGTNLELRGNVFEEFYNVNDHWNIVPSVSYINVSRYIGDGFIVGVTGTLNRIDQLGDSRPTNELQHYAVDGDVSYSFKELIGTSWFDPYVTVGAGYTWLDSQTTGGTPGFGTANGGIGTRFWLSENFNVGLQSIYKHVFEEEEGPKHFQHSISLGFSFGGKDTDGDGIYDKDDACPEVAGIPEFDGCPDSDGDGIQDSKDACPTVAGSAEFEGCPDTDGDGIPDPKDACPTVAGVSALGGCPDADGDGIKDADDGCPNEAGPRANNGCPYQDKDGDGVLDKDDECPDDAGSVANNGCPEVSVEVLNDLNVQFKSVLFDYNAASIRPESHSTLDNVAKIMNDFPKTRFLIEGHTDDRGRDSYNLNLSHERAASVRNYLTSHGISASRLESKGIGEARPIASNKTAAGRQENRRVELSILK